MILRLELTFNFLLQGKNNMRYGPTYWIGLTILIVAMHGWFFGHTEHRMFPKPLYNEHPVNPVPPNDHRELQPQPLPEKPTLPE